MANVRATACICALGTDAYHAAAAAAMQSVLDRTDWDVVLATDRPAPRRFAAEPRVTAVRLAPVVATDRPGRFLAKFDAIERALDASDTPYIVQLDADARVVRWTTGDDVAAALGGHGLGMVEQAGIRGSTMGRAEFLAHYRDHALRVIDPGAPVPDLAAFRYFNSGVVLAHREELAALTADARRRVAVTPTHIVGEHIVADQDYFQHWALTLRPGSCAELGWEWNHCSWWHDPFPRDGARILHFSNFTDGPTPESLAEMDAVSARVAAGRLRGSDVAAVIVTHRSAGAIVECVRAVRLAGVEHVVVVDNASDDGTIARAEAAGCDVLALPRNHGFAVAANAGARLAAAPVVAFVNPDCVIDAATVQRGAELCADKAVLAVPDFVGPDGRITAGVRGAYTRRRLLADLAGTRRRTRRLAPQSDRLPRLDASGWSWPLGACVLAPRAAFLRLGGFDERWFLYMEDVDLGRRWCAVGGRVESTGTVVAHTGQAGADVDGALRRRLLARARVQYARQVHGPVTGLAARVIAGGLS